MNSFSFEKEKRLLKRSEFKEIFDCSQRLFSTNLIAFWKVTDSKHSRLGLVVSKKVGNAVVRSRVKRRIRESFRMICAEKMVEKSYQVDFVILAKSKAAMKGFHEIDRDLIDLTRRITHRIESK